MKALLITIGLIAMFATSAFCEIKYIDSYVRRDGTYVSGHFRDTSNNGYSYDNANELGYNRRPRGIYD